MAKRKRVKCPKCGFENLPEARYCSSCREELGVDVRAVGGRFEGLTLLHLVGSFYVLVSLVFNEVVRASLFFMVPYLVSGVLGLVCAWGFSHWSSIKVKGLVKLLSVISVGVGLIGTFLLFVIGLDLKGIVGPAWLIFLVSAWKLWRDWIRLGRG
jgi:hypothetical protein